MIEITRTRQATAQKAHTGPEMPFIAPDDIAAINHTPSGQKRPQGQLKPFTALDGSNYRIAYREVCNYHERHNPPRLDDDGGEAYWKAASDDMIAVARKYHDDPFIIGMLITAYEELERQFKLLREREEAR